MKKQMDTNQDIIPKLLSSDVQDFIKENRAKNVADLALHRPKNAENWPYQAILDQIKAFQKQGGKFNPWLEKSSEILLPAHSIIEQASSHILATFKASLVSGHDFVDLTMGSGLDSWALSHRFKKGLAIDLDSQNISFAAHNFKILGLDCIAVKNVSAENYVEAMDTVDCIYVDPQRRDQIRKGHIRFEDCQPNIIELMSRLKQKTAQLLVKASPMLDITRAMDELGYVTSVFVVEWRRECRELLFLCDFNQRFERDDVPIHAISIDDQSSILYDFETSRRKESECQIMIGDIEQYLYEPGPAFMKVGAFKTLSKKYAMHKLHVDTHLYSSSKLVKDFPGRIFKVCNVFSANKKELAKFIPERKANLAIRNFPMHIDVLKKKLGIKDGGDEYIFACTNQRDKKILIHGQKIQ